MFIIDQVLHVCTLLYTAEADPGRFIGGGTNPSKGGTNLIYFSEKPHEIKEILVWGGGGVPGARP